jgi:hypothetical protein
MNLYFCETCGKRLTDIDLMRKDALDKQAKGVFCKTCAVGVKTEQFDAIEQPKAPAVRDDDQPIGRAPSTTAAPVPPPGVPRPMHSPSPSSGLKTLRPAHARKGLSKELDRTSAQPRMRGEGGNPDSRMALYVGGAAVAITVIGALILMSRSGSSQPSTASQQTAPLNERPSPNPQKPPGTAPSASPAPLVITPSPPPTPTLTTPPTPLVPLVSTSAISATSASSPAVTRGTDMKAPAAKSQEDRASVAFDEMRKALSKIDPEKKDEQAALIEKFLKEFADSDVGPRASVMLSNLRKPPEPAAAVAPPTPPAPAPNAGGAAEKGERDLFNKKDLTGWTLRGDEGACRVENGEMVFDGEKSISAIVASPSKDFTVVMDVYMDDGGGAYIEIHTRAGVTCLDRSRTNEWLTIQITVKGNTQEAKMLKGKGAAVLPADTGERPDEIRIHAMMGGKKHIRSVRVVSASP